jgi:hypothetical protein
MSDGLTRDSGPVWLSTDRCIQPRVLAEPDPLEQQVHLIAVALVALAVSLVMTPAAYHRQTHPDKISRHFILVSSRFLLWSMFPLLAAICIEFYLLARLVLHNTVLSVLFALILAVLFIVPWFLLPRIRGLQRLIQR